MNKTKRGLIMAAAILNIITVSISLIMSILFMVYGDALQDYEYYSYLVSIYSTNIVYAVIAFAAGIAGSILLLYSIRKKGNYFRRSQGLYATGLVLAILFGGWLTWALLFISMFIPDVVVMNTRSEVRMEEKREQATEKQHEKDMDEKKKQIEELKRLRDNGLITEEEYQQKLFELL